MSDPGCQIRTGFSSWVDLVPHRCNARLLVGIWVFSSKNLEASLASPLLNHFTPLYMKNHLLNERNLIMVVRNLTFPQKWQNFVEKSEHATELLEPSSQVRFPKAEVRNKSERMMMVVLRTRYVEKIEKWSLCVLAWGENERERIFWELSRVSFSSPPSPPKSERTGAIKKYPSGKLLKYTWHWSFVKCSF